AVHGHFGDHSFAGQAFAATGADGAAVAGVFVWQAFDGGAANGGVNAQVCAVLQGADADDVFHGSVVSALAGGCWAFAGFGGHGLGLHCVFIGGVEVVHHQFDFRPDRLAYFVAPAEHGAGDCQATVGVSKIGRAHV